MRLAILVVRLAPVALALRGLLGVAALLRIAALLRVASLLRTRVLA